MKAILMSIRPQHLVNILNGKKTIELRKKFPSDFRGWVYCYCTLGKPYLTYGYDYYMIGEDDYEEYKVYVLHDARGDWTYLNNKVVCRFWVDNVEEIYKYGDTCHFTNKLSGQSLTQFSKLSDEELENYLGYGGNKIEVCGYAIHISKLEIFDKPKDLTEFYYFKKRLIDCGMDCPPYFDEVKAQVHKAPQSWQYIYIEEDK